MQAAVAVLRPKQNASFVSSEFHPGLYEILLQETTKLPKRSPGGSRISDEEVVEERATKKTVKHLPTTSVVLDNEPCDALLTYLYKITGGDSGGLKGKHTVFVPPSSPVNDNSHVCGMLYCISVDANDKLNSVHLAQQPSLPTFYSLDLVLQTLNSSVVPYHKQTRLMLQRLHSWLQEQHGIPGKMNLLFSSSAEDRLKWSITNPAYRDDSPFMAGMPSMLSDGSMLTLSKEAHTKMLAADKCDITKINPLFGSDLVYKCKVDKVVVNKFWGLGQPDYSKVSSAADSGLGFLTDTATRSMQPPPFWAKDYPLHQCAAVGDAEGIERLLREGWSALQKDRNSLTPLHHAAVNGHINAVSVLLNRGQCTPNLINDSGSTPLHLAASQGKAYIVELLLSHQDTDVNLLDKLGKTALDYCETITKTQWVASANLLRFAMSQPTPTIQVYLMDGSCRLLNLVSKANTTVQQLHQQMMKALNLPENCNHLFTIWICSRNLQLQLKPEHKPIQHLNDWKRRIVTMLTDQDPNREDPQLFWRRDAILSIDDEKKVKHHVAINLLFLEAYHNYIKSLYPCAEHDATILAGILLQLQHGDFDPVKQSQYHISEQLMPTLIPHAMVQNRYQYWSKTIIDQYRHYSKNMITRERTMPILQMHFLTICWNLTAYGSAFFTGYVQTKGRVSAPVYIGVNDIGIHIITVETKTMWKSFIYGDIEWQLKRSDYPMLEIKTKSSGGRQQPQAATLHTKQAGLIEHLMTKLSQLHGGN